MFGCQEVQVAPIEPTTAEPEPTSSWRKCGGIPRGQWVRVLENDGRTQKSYEEYGAYSVCIERAHEPYDAGQNVYQEEFRR